MPMIDGAVLKQIREKRGLTQEALASESHVDKGTISRRERDGKPGPATTPTIERLCKALKVDRAVLSGDAPLPDELTKRPDRPKGELRIKMDDQNRNALALVSMRYGVSPDAVLGIAPLLFYAAAEASLAKRRDACAAVEAALDAVHQAVGRLPANPTTYDGASEKAVETERASIKRRDLFVLSDQQDDVFGVHYDPSYDDGEHNPFVEYLKSVLAEVTPTNETSDTPAAEISHWYPAYAPAYHVCRDEALAIVNGNVRAARGILNGWAALHEMRRELPNSTPQQQEAWAMERVEKADRDLAELIGEIPELQS